MRGQADERRSSEPLQGKIEARTYNAGRRGTSIGSWQSHLFRRPVVVVLLRIPDVLDAVRDLLQHVREVCAHEFSQVLFVQRGPGRR